jgi:hypothetical protein
MNNITTPNLFTVRHSGNVVSPRGNVVAWTVWENLKNKQAGA